MDCVPIDSIRVGERFRKDPGDMGALSRSIAEVGLLHPVVITSERLLIAGKRRLDACKGLGWAGVPVRIVDPADILRAEHDENAVRKDFLPSEAVAIWQAMKPKEQEEAKERMVVAHVSPAKFAEQNRGNTRDKIARYVGVSGYTLEKAAAVVEAAAREPEKFALLVDQMDKTGKVNGVYRRLKVLEQAQEMAQEAPPLPTGPFRIIVVDPPWEYEKRAEDATHRANLPYPSMSAEQIKALPVASLAAGDCILWLWTTNAHMRLAFEVLDAWGFEQKTILTWVKDRMGVGDWLRGQTEHCIMAVRGHPVVTLTNQTTVIHGPLREHSRKPEEFYSLVEALCPGSKVELFARTPREGWAAHGNDIGRFPGVA